VLRQVARQQDQVGLLGHALERLADTVAVARPGVDVACGGYADCLAHLRVCNRAVSTPIFGNLLDAMKRAAAALRDNEIPFALAGSLAVYARGGPETDHDVDFVLAPKDAERALEVLEEAGFRSEVPPEGWLYKVYDENDAMIDLIFAPNGSAPDVVERIVAHAGVIEVYAIKMKVMSATDVLASKLNSLREHSLDYEPALEVARALREQIDWAVLADLTRDSPYAQAFFTLARELELTPP
jgi:hypothetical protein